MYIFTYKFDAIQFNPMRKVCLIILLFILSSPGFAQRITVAYGGGGSANPDSCLALNANVNAPYLITEDRAGNVFYYDRTDYCVYKIDVFGIVRKVGGGGALTADSVLATNSNLYGLTSICANSAGDVYVANVNSIRRIDAATGLIFTIAGSIFSSGFSGDGGPATAARFNSISKICTDLNDNIYVCDKNNHRIRYINGWSTIVLTFAGNGGTTFSVSSLGGASTSTSIGTPTLVAVNMRGDVYIYTSSYILKVDRSTGYITSHIGGGSSYVSCTASQDSLGSLTDLCVHDSDDVCFTGANACRWLDPVTDSVFYYSGSAAYGYIDDTNSLRASMANCLGVASASKKHSYLIDYVNKRIRKVVHASSSPVFAFGNHRAIAVCHYERYGLFYDLEVADVDSGQTETWTIIGTPRHGTTSGFPATARSVGRNKTTKPLNVYYRSDSAYYGLDTFYVRVSDSVTADTMMVVANTNYYFAIPRIVGPDSFCVNSRSTISYSISSGDIGTWRATSGRISLAVGSGSRSSSYVYPVSSGIDTIVVNAGASCPFQIRKVVTVVDPPIVGPVIGPDTLCPGSISIYTDTSIGGTWSESSRLLGVYGTIGATTGSYRAPRGAGGYDSIIYSYTSRFGCTSYTGKRVFVNSAVHPITFPSMCIGTTDSVTTAISSSSRLVFSRALASIVTSTSTGFRLQADSAGIGWLYYIDSNSCGVDTARCNILVDTPRAIGAITGPPEICVYGYGTFSISSSLSTGTWQLTNSNARIVAGPTVLGYSAGSDSIIYTYRSGACTSSVGLAFSVIRDLPTVTRIIGPSTLCRGATTAYFDSTSGGVWSMGSSIGSITGAGIFTASRYGTANIIYGVTNACGTTNVSASVLIDTLPLPGTIRGARSNCPGTPTSYSIILPNGHWSMANAHAHIDSFGNVTGVTMGWDSVLYTITNVCGTSVSVLPLHIDSIPVAGPIIGGDSICMGTFSHYHGTDSGGYWHTFVGNAGFDSLGTLNGLRSGFDTIIYTITNACGTDTAYKNIYVNEPPYAGIVIGPEIVCTDSSITLTNTVPGGVWSAANGNATVSATGIVTGVNVGTDTIYCSLSNTCGTNSSVQHIYIINCFPAGVENLTASDFELFPNPAYSTLNIKVPNDGDVEIVLNDVAGREIEVPTTKVANRQYQLDLARLTAGVYVVKVKSGGEIFTSKLVLE